MLAAAGLRIELLSDPSFLIARSRVLARHHPGTLATLAASPETLGEHTAFDGLCGIDFFLDDDGRPLLSELNPRPTPGHGMRPDVRDLFARAVRRRLSGEHGKPETITRSSGPMHHFPEYLRFAATEPSVDTAFGVLESLRRVPVDEPGVAYAFAQRAWQDGVAERRRRTVAV